MAEIQAKSENKLANWFYGLKTEFGKIVWPDRMTIIKQTAAVVAVSLALGVLIALLDWIISQGINIIVNLGI